MNTISENTSLKIDWKIQVVKLVSDYFRSIGIRYEGRTEFYECLVDFMNLELKLIDPVPRTVFASHKFKGLRIPERNRSESFP